MSASGGAVFGIFGTAKESIHAMRAAAVRMPQARYYAVRVLLNSSI